MKVLFLIITFLFVHLTSLDAQEDTSKVVEKAIEFYIENKDNEFSKYVESTESQDEHNLEMKKVFKKIENGDVFFGNSGQDDGLGSGMGGNGAQKSKESFNAADYFDQRRESANSKLPPDVNSSNSGTNTKSTNPDEELEGKPKAMLIISSEEEEATKRLLGPSQYDSRIEARAMNPSVFWQNQILERTKSVGMIVENTQLTLITDSIYQLEVTSTLGERYQLCPGEAFENQPTVGIGSAFVASEHSMISANHVFLGDVKNYSVVFGFEIINKLGTYEVFIPAGNVYRIDSTEKVNLELDLIQFHTTRKISQRVLEFQTTDKSKVGDEIYMVGYPMGLPQKVAVNAGIRSTEYPYHYYTSLDAFRGNSGSPVFDFTSGKVIGVLVSGGSDYEWNGTCNQSVTCNFPQCNGERVSRITYFIEE